MNSIWKKQWENALTVPNSDAAAHWKEISLMFSPKTFIDVGAGEIYSEAWEVVNTHPLCKIIGFEPQPARFETLKKYKYPGILLPYVISDVNAIVEGYMGYPEGKSDFWLFGENQDPAAYKKIQILSHTLDEVEKDFGPLDDIFIWADVEGSELSVLKGAQRLFDENKIIGINVEVRKVALSPRACNENQIIEFLKKNNFKPIPHSKGSSHYDIAFVKND
jgi:FkbM family methyltransferase